MKSAPIILILAATISAATSASAQKPPAPKLFQKMIDCRSISDNAQRLACYDQSVGDLQAAEARKEVVVVDREQMRETRKSLFGFTLPKIGLFGGDKAEEEIAAQDVNSIEGSIQSARSIAGDRWSLVLANDAGTWETMSPIKFEPRSGQAISISKAAMGSYLGRFGSNRGVRFRRVN